MSVDRMIHLIYRFRWPLCVFMLATVFGLFFGGIHRLTSFLGQVDTLKETPPKSPSLARTFDARFDIWFHLEDKGLKAFKDIEDQFIAADVFMVAFEETKDPWGVFGIDSLETIDRLTKAIEKVPGVRNVRSLTSNPWIRWGSVSPGEQGLLVTDLFDKPPKSYSDKERLDRMIAVMGAKGASAVMGQQRIHAHIGENKFEDYIGEPRLMDSVVSADGRTTAILVQILRSRVPTDRLTATFGDNQMDKAVAPAILTNEIQWSALDAIEDIIAKEKRQIYLAGMPTLERNFMRVGVSDMKYMGLMFAVIAIALMAVYKTIGGVGVPLLIVFSTVMGMLGSVFLKGDLLNNLTAIAPNMMTAVGIADSVHLVTAYYKLRGSFTNKALLIQEVLKRNWLPVFLTSITTAIGFFSLVTSEIVPMQMLGYTGGIGAIFAYLLSIFVIPAFLSLIPLKEKSEKEVLPIIMDDVEVPHWTDRVIDLIDRWKAVIALGSFVLLGISVWGVYRINITSDFREMFPPYDPSIRDLRFIESKLGGTGDLELVFFGPEAKVEKKDVEARQARIEALEIKRLQPDSLGLQSSEVSELTKLKQEEEAHQRQRVASSHFFLEQVDRFQSQVRQESKDPDSPLRVFTSFDSALDVLRKMHQVQNQNKATYYRIPTPEDIPAEARQPMVEYDDILEEFSLIPPQTASSMASQYFLQFENGAKPSENLGSMITADRRGFRITVRVASAPAIVHLKAYERIREILRDDYPQLAVEGQMPGDSTALSLVTLTGKHYLFTNMVQKFSYTLISSLSLALFVITIMISFIYRSAVIGVLSLVPNGLPLVMPIGFMGVFGLPLDGPAVLVCAVALGVCVDDTIHLLTKFTHAQQDGLGTIKSLRRAFRQVGGALSSTTFVLILGFAVLTLSDFRPNMLIGYLGVIMIALAWVADFLILPALLIYTQGKK